MSERICDGSSVWRSDVKPGVCRYVAPRHLDEVLDILADPDLDAKVISGGQSLVPLMSMRLVRPELLVDIGRLDGLDRIDMGETLTIGATATQSMVESSLAAVGRWPVLARAIGLIGHPQIRNRGTVCGNLAHHDPASELPAVAVALDAVMNVVGPQGSRSIAAADFFVSTFETALDDTELLISVTFPGFDPAWGWGVEEVARRHGDFAMVGAVTVLRPMPTGVVDRASIVLFGVGPKPFRATVAEDLLAGRAPDDELIDTAASAAATQCDPGSDIHATAADRRAMVEALVRRSLAISRERMG